MLLNLKGKLLYGVSFTMSFNFANFTKDLKSFGDKLSTEFNNEVVPFAQRTTRLVQERIGKVNVDDISQLPAEYVELASKCNNIEALYKNVLKVTNNYSNESYDYPSNLQELFNDFSKNVTTRFTNLSKATTPSEAQAALTDPTTDFKPPKTLYHALSRATDASVIASNNESDTLITALDSYSSNLNKIGNARLGQDQLIESKFNKPLTTTLRQLISQSNNIQKKVEQKRIDYDLARVSLSTCNNPNKESQLRVNLENAEDEFANTVEDAINVMQNVLKNAKPIHELLELIKAQLAYHQLASQLLGKLATDFQDLADDTNKESTARDSAEFDI